MFSNRVCSLSFSNYKGKTGSVKERFTAGILPSLRQGFSHLQLFVLFLLVDAKTRVFVTQFLHFWWTRGRQWRVSGCLQLYHITCYYKLLRGVSHVTHYDAISYGGTCWYLRTRSSFSLTNLDNWTRKARFIDSFCW